jgi:hypothetical protein
MNKPGKSAPAAIGIPAEENEERNRMYVLLNL